MKAKKQISIMDYVKPYIGLVLLIILFAILTKGQSLTMKNIKIVTEQSLALMLTTMGVFFVMTTGMMDLSVSGVVCVCCYVLAKACSVNIPLGLVLTLLTGVALGLFNGITTSVLKVPSFLATLCTAYICTGVMTHFISSSSAIVPFELYVADTFAFKVPMVIVLILLVTLVFNFKPFGHFVRLIGSNETGAHYSAIDVTKVKILCFVINGALAACAAFLIGIRSGTAALSTGSDLMFNTMIALTLGGFPFGGGAKARISAAVVGSFTTYVLSNGMLLVGMSATTMQLIKGALFLTIILFTSPTFKLLLDKVGQKAKKKQSVQAE